MRTQSPAAYTYTYDWSARGQLQTEWTEGVPVRTFTYNGAGQMIEATVFTQTTRFRYNGLGARVAVEVVGHGTTTYTLDYAAGDRILAEEAGGSATLYLYGRDCLGEQRGGEWLYYLPDAEGYVRQGTDAQGNVASTWLFDPDGTLLEGPEGPVSHLVCGGVYDSSTGLIYRDGRYFDPLLGIWLALMPLIVVQSWKRRKKGRGWSWCSLLLLGICLTGVLTGCEDGGEGSPVPCTDWPTLKSLSANTEGHIAVSPGAEINQDPHFEWLHYGTAPPPEAAMNTYYDLPDRPGVIFQAEIEIPDPVADGELHFVQTIATQRIKRAGEEIYYLGGEPTEWYIDAPEGTNLYSTITPIVSEYKGVSSPIKSYRLHSSKVSKSRTAP